MLLVNTMPSDDVLFVRFVVMLIGQMVPLLDMFDGEKDKSFSSELLWFNSKMLIIR